MAKKRILHPHLRFLVTEGGVDGAGKGLDDVPFSEFGDESFERRAHGIPNPKRFIDWIKAKKKQQKSQLLRKKTPCKLGVKTRPNLAKTGMCPEKTQRVCLFVRQGGV